MFCNGCSKLLLTTASRPLSGSKKMLQATCTKYNEELRAMDYADAKTNLQNLPALESNPGVLVSPLPRCEGKE